MTVVLRGGPRNGHRVDLMDELTRFDVPVASGPVSVAFAPGPARIQTFGRVTYRPTGQSLVRITASGVAAWPIWEAS